MITNWFQTEEAYEFFAAQPDLFRLFKVETDHAHCIGYVTVAKNPLVQAGTARAIIMGGPALAEDCTNEEVAALMQQVRTKSEELGAIYVETRNLNDYSKWREGFEKAGFVYEEHLNFHVHTDQPWETIEENIGKHRKKHIRLSYRDGATEVENPTIENYKSVLDK